MLLDLPQKRIKFGMVKLGIYTVNIYPNSGIMQDIRGRVIFKGNCYIGNKSFISIGEKGVLEFGETFSSTTSIKIVCYNSIKFGNHVLIGWDCLFMDTDFHKLTRLDGSQNCGYGPISIGDEVWAASGCKILKDTIIPCKCVVSSGSIIAESINVPQFSVIGNNTDVIIKRKRTYRNYKDDKVYN